MQLARSMEEVFKKKGFCFIEVLSPCPTLYQRRNKMGDGLETMKYLQEGQQNPQWRAHQRVRSDQGRRDRGRQVRGSRPPRLSRTAAVANDGDARRALRGAGDRLHGGGGDMQSLTEIRIAGFGGQGVILAAAIIGKAQASVPGRLRHHDPELRTGGPRRLLQRAGDSLRANRSSIPM